MVSSRFPEILIFILLALFSVSFVLSLFLMQLFGGLIFILWLFEKWNEKKKAPDIITAGILLFGFVRIISIIYSEYPQISYEAFYKEALFYLMAMSLPFYLKTLDKRKLLDLSLIFILGAVVMSLVGIFRFSTGDVERAQGFTSSYSAFSSYITIALGVALFFPIKKYNPKFSGYQAIVIFILAAGIITSLGRLNIALAALMILTALVFKRFNIKQFVILITIFAGFGIFYLLNPTKGITDRVENITQYSDRDIILKGAGEILYEHPVLGFGPRTFKKIFPLFDEVADKGIGGWHNDFIQIYFESGMLGLITFLALLYIIFMMAIRQIRNKKTEAELRDLSASVLISITALTLSIAAGGFITSVVVSIVFILLISILSRIDVEPSQELIS
jgi:O-antigen ligase